MQFSEAWLRTFVSPALEARELVEQLTMAGLEVDSVMPAAADFQGVVVGEVIDLKPHPDADRLQVCTVAIGDEAPLQIVCGAANVYRGMRAPTALVGARLPGDFRIKKSKLRGEASHGMLCSEKELGLADDAAGLMELPSDAPVGADIREYLELDDAIITLDLTPNRADCLSVEGVAREVAALNDIACEPLPVAEIEISHSDELPISIAAPDACPRYLGRLIRKVDPSATTPLWMQERLRRSGLRSLGPLVDVTNYVLLELGQPLHAFDAARLQGGITVRSSRSGEQIALLNDQTIVLDDDTLVIADDHKPLALAGIMGGKESAVSDETTDIFLECAFFAPSLMMGKARRYGLHTDSSHRFERGVDPELQHRALLRATDLICAIAGGEAGPVTEAVHQRALPERPAVTLRADQVRKLLGIKLTQDEIESILSRLGMSLEPLDGEWRVIPPSFRFDIAIEADLIEEIGRVYGYNNIAQRRPLIHAELRGDSETQLDINRVKDLLVARGYREAITYSFVDAALQAKITPNQSAIALANPLSSDLSVMRTTLWTGLLQTAQKNNNRQQQRVRIFETGLRFLRENGAISQEKQLAGLAMGPVYEEQWAEDERPIDFYDIKADVEAILSLSSSSNASFVAASHPALHPGQCAEIVTPEGARIGWLGMLHPSLEKELELASNVFLFELAQEPILEKRLPSFETPSKFPSVRRDLALIVDRTVTADRLLETIRGNRNPALKEVKIFDLYCGPGVELNKKSIALGLILQDSSRTLIDSEIDAVVAEILDRLAKELDVKLRT